MQTLIDRTYLTEGSFNAFDIITNVLLPKQNNTSRYRFGKAYNISKKINGDDVNAICFFMTKGGTTDPLFDGDTYYQNVFDVSALLKTGIANVVPFDTDRNECIVVIMHNPIDDNLIQDVFDNLNHDYAQAKINEPHVRTAHSKSASLVPRRLGVSIIRK